MFFTKECDYGLRIIRALAPGEKKTVASICDTGHIPYQYAYKILKKLERAGFVQSFKGREGGYQLVRSTHSLTIYDVASAVDENLFLFECLREDKSCPFKTSENPCAVHLEFERIQNALMGEMRAKSLGEVLSE